MGTINVIYMSNNVQEKVVADVTTGTTVTLSTDIPTNKPENSENYNFLGYSLTENGEVVSEYEIPENATDDITFYAVWEAKDNSEDNTTTDEELSTNVNMDNVNDSYLVVLKKIADAYWKKNGKENYQNKADNRVDALIEIKEAIRGKSIEDCTTDEEKEEYIKNQPVTILQGLIAILNAINDVDDNFNNVNYPEDYVPEIPNKFSLYDALIDGEAFTDTDYQENIRIFPDGCMTGKLYRKTYNELDDEGNETENELNGYSLTINTANLDSTISSVSIFALKVDEHCQTIISTDDTLEIIINKQECSINGGNKNTEICINAYDENNNLLDCIVLSMKNLVLTREEKSTVVEP